MNMIIFINYFMRRVISRDMVVGCHGKTVNAIAIAFILSAESNELILLFDFQSYLLSCSEIRCIKKRLLFFFSLDSLFHCHYPQDLSLVRLDDASSISCVLFLVPLMFLSFFMGSSSLFRFK